MNPMLKILRINMCIQQFQVKVYLDGKEIVCVSLDGTYATNEQEVTEPLTDAQLEDLFQQTMPAGATKLQQE